MRLLSRARHAPGGPLRVGWLVTPLSPEGGTVTHLRRWYEGLDPAVVQPTLYYYSAEEDEGAILPLPEGLPRVRIPTLDLRRRDPKAAVSATIDALRARPVDILHSIFIGADLVALLTAGLLRLPVMSSVEGELFVSHMPATRRTVLSTLYRLLSSNFSAVTAVSEATARGLEPYRRKNAPPVEVLHPGVRLPVAAPPRTDEGPVLVAVGRIVPVKGLPLLIEAIERLRGRHPSLRVFIVGDGPDRDPLWAMIRSRNLDDIVQITGWVSEAEVGRWLERAHLLVLPSYSEGLPWAALEAMAYGVPVVAARVGGLPELVVEGPEEARTGWLVEPNRSDRLTAAIAGALEGDWRTRLEAVGRQARARVAADFSLEAEVRQLTALYRRVAGERGRR